ncbi:MAG: urease accessory protein UreF [Gammaproteobacteria bacterium]|nr:urease accessory protein UreF [Gammaproteobacteria bacterium]
MELPATTPSPAVPPLLENEEGRKHLAIPLPPSTRGVWLLHLLHLASPALPVGAYSYSQGLEYAVEAQWVRDEASAFDWIAGLLSHTLAHLDVPVTARLYHAWQHDDAAEVLRWSHFLLANREARELQDEDRNMGLSLARLLNDLGLNEAAAWCKADSVCFLTLFTLAAQRWNISLSDATHGYLWSWAENQVLSSVKLIPLGQTAGQRLLTQLIPRIAQAVDTGLALHDDDIGFSAPGLAVAGALHETQYSRLFRS